MLKYLSENDMNEQNDNVVIDQLLGALNEITNNIEESNTRN